MSKNRNYFNMYNKNNNNNNNNNVQAEETPAAVEEAVVEAPVEIEAAEEVAEEIKPEKVVKDGVVVNCAKLNVRKAPSKDADILGVISRYDDVKVYVDESTEDFYKVCTEAGVEGYCVKTFIGFNS